MRAKHVTNEKGVHYGVRFECPGCKEAHVVPTLPHMRGWVSNDDYERPTLSPSILVHQTKRDDGTIVIPRCHSFVRDGRIEFLGDCDHALAGQTVDLPEIETESSSQEKP